jgi:thioesterase domain-containing protein
VARLLREGGREAPTGVVPLASASADAPPLILIPAALETVAAYAELAGGIAGVSVFGVELSIEPGESIEALAARHADAIRTAWPQGPYRLAGWSLGGVLAFETARRLGDVQMVALLDSFLASQPVDPQHPALLEQLARDLQLDVAPRGAPELLEAARRLGRLPPDLSDQQGRALIDGYRRRVAAWSLYRPAAYPGRVVLYEARARESGGDLVGPWRGVAGCLEVHAAAGDHRSMIRGPHAHELAAALKSALEDVP